MRLCPFKPEGEYRGRDDAVRLVDRYDFSIDDCSGYNDGTSRVRARMGRIRGGSRCNARAWRESIGGTGELVFEIGNGCAEQSEVKLTRIEDPCVVIGVPEDQIDYHAPGEPPRPEYLEALRADLRTAGFRGDRLPHEGTEIGRGAGGVALVVFLTAVFLSGKTIIENIDAWIAIAGKVKALAQRIRDKSAGPIYYSESVALALAVCQLSEAEDHGESLKLVYSEVVPLRGGFKAALYEEDFRTNPVRYYLFVFSRSQTQLDVIWMKSSGEIVVRKELLVEEYFKFHGFDPNSVG